MSDNKPKSNPTAFSKAALKKKRKVMKSVTLKQVTNPQAEENSQPKSEVKPVILDKSSPDLKPMSPYQILMNELSNITVHRKRLNTGLGEAEGVDYDVFYIQFSNFPTQENNHKPSFFIKQLNVLCTKIKGEIFRYVNDKNNSPETTLSYLEEKSKELNNIREKIEIARTPNGGDDIYFIADLDYNKIIEEFSSDRSIPANLIAIQKSLSPFVKHTYDALKIIIDFIILKFGQVSSNIFSSKELTSNTQKSITLNIPKSKIIRLDIRQTAVLFYYLWKHSAILKESNKYISKAIQCFTGHSAQNIRTYDGFSLIDSIIKDDVIDKRFQHIPHYNITGVKKLLEEIIDDINSEIYKDPK